MKLQQARELAERWVDCLAPQCERIEIAGGVRRGKPEPHDIEIVCIPRTDTEQDMFGDIIGDKSCLEALINGMIGAGMCEAIKNGPKYKQLALPQGINLDLFIVHPETWAVQFVIRTGPKEFGHWCVKKRKYGGALPSNLRVKDGLVWSHGKPLPLKEERDFLDLLGLGWVEPKDRRPGLPIKVEL